MTILPQSQNPRIIKYIVIHCTAGPQTQTVEQIQNYWKSIGWKNPGYHYMIKPNGETVQLQDLSRQTNGVKGYNAHSIHVNYIGGVDAAGKPVDNRTVPQKLTMLNIIRDLKAGYPNAVVLGHRDFSTDLNGNGIIEQWEWIKYCPCFDVRDWLRSIDVEKELQPAGIVYKLNTPLIKNEKVKEIQQALNTYSSPVLKVDGIFGKNTDTSVRNFQKEMNLPVTGIVDAATSEKLGISL